MSGWPLKVVRPRCRLKYNFQPSLAETRVRGIENIQPAAWKGTKRVRGMSAAQSKSRFMQSRAILRIRLIDDISKFYGRRAEFESAIKIEK